MPTDKTLIELICTTPEDCALAEQGGADRIELCSAIEMGGLTPSFGTLKKCLGATTLPIMAMVRPRSGGFDYSQSEFEVMLADVEAFRQMGATGIVFGILTESRTIDVPRSRAMVDAAGSMETVFHRAFDAITDPKAGLEQLVQLTVKRLLTSGQKPTALQGSELIKSLVTWSRNRIDILPGSGLRAHNIRRFIQETGVDQVHLTAFSEVPDLSMAGVELAFNSREIAETSYRAVSVANVEEIRSALL